MTLSTKYQYRYYHREGHYWVPCTRQEWLDTLLSGQHSSKPPASWMAQQGLLGRSERSAGVIWNTAYDISRKYAIWDQATEEDFRAAGYFV